jgi:hypothetical protein
VFAELNGEENPKDRVHRLGGAGLYTFSLAHFAILLVPERVLGDHRSRNHDCAIPISRELRHACCDGDGMQSKEGALTRWRCAQRENINKNGHTRTHPPFRKAHVCHFFGLRKTIGKKIKPFTQLFNLEWRLLIGRRNSALAKRSRNGMLQK